MIKHSMLMYIRYSSVPKCARYKIEMVTRVKTIRQLCHFRRWRICPCFNMQSCNYPPPSTHPCTPPDVHKRLIWNTEFIIIFKSLWLDHKAFDWNHSFLCLILVFVDLRLQCSHADSNYFFLLFLYKNVNICFDMKHVNTD